MDSTINNEEDLVSVINDYGDITVQVASLRKKLEIKKAQLREYCNRTGLKKYSTKEYNFGFKSKGCSLIHTSQTIKTEDVVAALREDKDGKAFIVETYDPEGIKKFANSLRNTDEWLEQFYLKLSEERTDIEVKPKRK